jgi:hypothetical protein
MSDSAPDLDLSLERVITAPHDARAAIGALLGDASNDDLWENALLATSEIVTHSLTHASGECKLVAWHSPAAAWLRVEVTDGGGELPNLVSDGTHQEVGGLRLAVLAEIPSAWGVEQTPFGRVVWFEVQGKPAAAPEAEVV